MAENADNYQDKEEQILKDQVKQSQIAYYKVLLRFLRAMLSLNQGTDKEKTTKEIKENIVFKGPSVCILICSVIIASIGLNVNSTAVVIGAMLISHLMGPIVGIGLAVGTNDFKLFTRSMKNFAIMVLVSMIASYLYFTITPLSEVQSELFARTKPTLLDVMLAIFGGLAGIIAGSRSEKSNVVPGVAIATALMPPLCTAGFGLATGQFNFFFGAFYLFLINSVFIALATFLVVRYLKFPMMEFMDKVREKRVKVAITAFALLVLAPSGFTFYQVVNESLYRVKAESFIRTEFDLPNTKVISQNIDFSGEEPKIEVFLIGEIIGQELLNHIQSQLGEYEIAESKLVVNQAKDASDDIKSELHTELSGQLKGDILEDLYRKNEEAISAKNQEIENLKERLAIYEDQEKEVADLKAEIRVQYPDIEQFACAQMLHQSTGNAENKNLTTFLVRWNKDLNPVNRSEKQLQLQRYLEVRLKRSPIMVVNY